MRWRTLCNTGGGRAQCDHHVQVSTGERLSADRNTEFIFAIHRARRKGGGTSELCGGGWGQLQHYSNFQQFTSARPSPPLLPPPPFPLPGSCSECRGMAANQRQPHEEREGGGGAEGSSGEETAEEGNVSEYCPAVG